MKTIKRLSTLGAALLVTASIGSAYADESDMTQTRTQERVRTEENLQTPTSDFGQARHREQKMEEDMEQNKNQFRNEYRYRNNFQTQQAYDAGSSMSRQNLADPSTRGKR